MDIFLLMIHLYPFEAYILTDSINSDLCKEEVESLFSNFDSLNYEYNGGENGLLF